MVFYQLLCDLASGRGDDDIYLTFMENPLSSTSVPSPPSITMIPSLLQVSDWSKLLVAILRDPSQPPAL